MGLNKVKGNMYGFVTHTWNTIKGKCPHDCHYCYMKRFPQNDVRFDEKELKTDLGSWNFIFVGSSCDMFADDIDKNWIRKTLSHCCTWNENRYLFQSKNPKKFGQFAFPRNSSICTTIETNRDYPKFMGNTPSPHDRSIGLSSIRNYDAPKKMITIEPIMDFDLIELVFLIKRAGPIFQVNIGADSRGCNMPEPHSGKINDLIAELSEFTTVHQKPNLKRLLK